jgi:hypothetical protein
VHDDDVARAYGGSLHERAPPAREGFWSGLSDGQSARLSSRDEVGQGVGVRGVCCMRQATLRSDQARAW